MASELTKHITVRRQFDAIIEGIEQEAINAAHTLGFKFKSKCRLATAVDREFTRWAKRYQWEWEGGLEHLAAYPVPRVACLALIGELLICRSLFGDVGLERALDLIDGNLKVLRRRLADAARQVNEAPSPRAALEA